MQATDLSRMVLLTLSVLLLQGSILVAQEESISKQKKMIIISSDDHKDFQIEEEDGKRTYYIDGKEVDESTFEQESSAYNIELDREDQVHGRSGSKMRMFLSDDENMPSIDSIFKSLSLELGSIEGFDFDSLLAHQNIDIHIKKLGEEFGEQFENFNFDELDLQQLLDSDELRDMPRILDFDFDIDHDISALSLSDQMQRELNEDGFLIKGKENEVELTGKHLKINGDKQPENIWNKYKELYEQNTGIEMTKDTKIKMKLEGKAPAVNQEKEIIIKKKTNRI